MSTDPTTTDRIEAAAQVLHERRHPLGYGQVCSRCRADAEALAALAIDHVAPAGDAPPAADEQDRRDLAAVAEALGAPADVWSTPRLLAWIASRPVPAGGSAPAHPAEQCGVIIQLQGLGDFPCVIPHDGTPGAHDGDCITQPEQDGTWPATARPMIVTLCGSMRFLPLMLQVAADETAAGRIVIAPFSVVAPEDQGSEFKVMLDELHRRKIDMADAVIVVSDETGYYGDSTAGEVGYAYTLGVPVEFREMSCPAPDPGTTTEVTALLRSLSDVAKDLRYGFWQDLAHAANWCERDPELSEAFARLLPCTVPTTAPEATGPARAPRQPGDVVVEGSPEETTATAVARIEREAVWLVLVRHEHGTPDELDQALKHLRVVWGNPPAGGAS